MGHRIFSIKPSAGPDPTKLVTLGEDIGGVSLGLQGAGSSPIGGEAASIEEVEGTKVAQPIQKVSAEQIARDQETLRSLYARFEAAQAAGNAAEADRLAEELILFAFNPNYQGH